MGKLDDKPMPSLREALNLVEDKRQKEIAAKPGPEARRPSGAGRRSALGARERQDDQDGIRVRLKRL